VRDASSRRAELKATKTRNESPKKTTTIDFQATERKTRKLLSMNSVGMSMGSKKLFDSLDLELTPMRRIGLLGVNGSGKTTLLRLMSGDLEPDQGTIKRAADLRVVTFSQHRGSLDHKVTLQEALCPVGDMVEYRDQQIHVSGWAKRFLFAPEQLPTLVGNLSGGEQARLLIANLMLEPADVLLLDEPTNDLDIPSLEVLEEALLEFPGALVLVTHDRFMLERIATEYIGLDDSGGARSFMSCEHWNRERRKKASRPSPPKSRESSNRPGRKPRSENETSKRLTWKEQKELKSMEQRILAAESDVEALEIQAASPVLSSDHQKATETYAALSKAQGLVKTLYARWADLDAHS
jgi:ATP-binding cassette subfamily F protein uup